MPGSSGAIPPGRLNGSTSRATGRSGPRRILVLPRAPLVASGPYLVFIAAVFTLLNACILYWRIRVENAALARAAELGTGAQTLANESRSL
jgi:hypothetical protein